MDSAEGADLQNPPAPLDFETPSLFEFSSYVAQDGDPEMENNARALPTASPAVAALSSLFSFRTTPQGGQALLGYQWSQVYSGILTSGLGGSQ